MPIQPTLFAAILLLDGVLAWTDAKYVSEDDSDTPFCTVTMPAGDVAPL